MFTKRKRRRQDVRLLLQSTASNNLTMAEACNKVAQILRTMQDPGRLREFAEELERNPDLAADLARQQAGWEEAGRKSLGLAERLQRQGA